MSITGSIYKVTKSELEGFKSKLTWNPQVESKELFLDSFFYDIYEVLTKYSDFTKEEMAPIIEGMNIIRKDEATIGYSEPQQVVKLNQVLENISTAQFDKFFAKAIEDKESYVYAFREQQIYVNGLKSYFEQLKQYFSETVAEGKSLLHIIG